MQTAKRVSVREWAPKLSKAFERRRSGLKYPTRIEDVIVDLDHTLIDDNAGAAAIRKIVSGHEDREHLLTEMRKIIGEVASGELDFADASAWGSQVQHEYGWTRRDWTDLADELFKSKLDRGVAVGLQFAQKQNRSLRIHLVSGASRDYVLRIRELLEREYGVKVHSVMSSEQLYESFTDPELRATTPRRFSPNDLVRDFRMFVGAGNSVSAVSKIDAARCLVRSSTGSTSLGRTAVISDSDYALMHSADIGIHVPSAGQVDVHAEVAIKHKLYDAISADSNPKTRAQLIAALLANPRDAMKLHLQGQSV